MPKIWQLLQFKNNIALIDENGASITYEELSAESAKIIKYLSYRNLVFCFCKNEIGSILGYVSFINNGMVPALLNTNIDPELLNKLLNLYKPPYLWVPNDFKENFYECECILEAYDYSLLRTNYNEFFPVHDDLALMLTTSGSTGSPKFVRQSYENVLHNARSIASYLELDENERPVTTLPMNYTYGLSIINSHLLVGSTILLTEKTLLQKEFWSFVRQSNATSIGGVPYTYEMLDKLRFYRMDLPALKTLTQAGGKITPELHEKFATYAQSNGKKFIVMYGQCEATARMAYLPHDKAIEKKGSMGIAIPNGKFRLIDSNSNEITTPYTDGELVYEGKNVTMGYAECGKDLIKGDERGGILHTGDIAQFDEDGYFYIVGRKSRFLKIYGNRVNLDEADRLIKSQFGIEVACAGVDDHMHIFITDENYSSRVRDFIARKTKLNPTAFEIKALKSIPKNDAGKTLYNELAKYYTECIAKNNKM